MIDEDDDDDDDDDDDENVIVVHLKFFGLAVRPRCEEQHILL